MKKFQHYIQEAAGRDSITVPDGMSLIDYIKDLGRNPYGNDIRDSGEFSKPRPDLWFYNAINDLYLGEAVPDTFNSWKTASKEGLRALNVMLSMKSKHPELRPDYTHIFRGIRRTVGDVMEMKNIRWSRFDDFWMIGKGGTYTSKTGISSWTYDEKVAWGFTNATQSMSNSNSIAIVERNIKKVFLQTLDTRKHMWVWRPAGIPIIMQKAVDKNTLFSEDFSLKLGKLMGYSTEHESIQVGTGPFKVEYFIPTMYYRTMEYLKFDPKAKLDIIDVGVLKGEFK